MAAKGDVVVYRITGPVGQIKTALTRLGEGGAGAIDLGITLEGETVTVTFSTPDAPAIERAIERLELSSVEHHLVPAEEAEGLLDRLAERMHTNVHQLSAGFSAAEDEAVATGR